MSPDTPHTSNPDEHAALLAHGALETAREEFAKTLTGFATRPSPQAATWHEHLSEAAPEMRALHALSVGYGWTEAIHRVANPDVLNVARANGYVVTDERTGCPVLTSYGHEALTRWRDFVSPLRDLPEYAPMWAVVNGLDG
ncbi:hypothetical protein FHX81_5669 [Saccharothrix saharensis]|uniref:Uncharacterized protein n=1 Tax=Saccharothrix saharensis TaxID=571190 RepID=A0A543JKF4_9PSEU|nr:hypothetical protein [Saccharothrix saharensis]TQM83251.1 hypothetical protein FHX81_5669 [Saccharothrix saharensis]